MAQSKMKNTFGVHTKKGFHIVTTSPFQQSGECTESAQYVAYIHAQKLETKQHFLTLKSMASTEISKV